MQAKRFHLPAGLDLGAHTPGEIAVWILAEIISVTAVVPPSPAPAAERADPVCGMMVAAMAGTPQLRHRGTTAFSAARPAVIRSRQTRNATFTP
jgi:xanthine dehydrogenase accessory factor